MKEGVLLLVGTIVAVSFVAMYIQVIRLDRLLEEKYPTDYAPFQNSLWGDRIFSPVMRFIKSGRFIDYNDAELGMLCRSVQNRFNIFAGLCSIVAIALFVLS